MNCYPIRIDKDIPVPEPRAKYPIRDLAVGESFFTPNLRFQLGAYRTRLEPKKFATRLWKENGVAGIRVWRVA